jgi:hypothetical protein
LDVSSGADPDSALSAALALAPGLARALALDAALPLLNSRVLHFDFDPEISLTLSRARLGEIDLDAALDRAHQFDLQLARTLTTGAASAMESSPSPSRTGRQDSSDELTQPLLESVTRLVMGEALSWALAQARRAATRSESPARRFAQAFANAVGAGSSRPPSDPDLTPETLHRAVEMLDDVLRKKHGAPGSLSWAAAVARRLVQDAEPVFSRAELLTRQKSTSTRLAALCLAAEGDELGCKEIGDMFRQVAAGITWLQNHASIDLSTGRVIMLAVDEPAVGPAAALSARHLIDPRKQLLS